MGQDLIAATLLALTMGMAAQAGTGPQGGPEILAGAPEAECPDGVVYYESEGVAYEPGVDAYGRSVAPASPDAVPAPRLKDEIAFTVTLNPLDEIDEDPDTSRRFEGTELAITDVEADLKTGALSLDGRPVVAGSRCASRAALAIPMPRPKPGH